MRTAETVAAAGLLLITAAAFLTSIPLGFAVFGLILLVVGLFYDFGAK